MILRDPWELRVDRDVGKTLARLPRHDAGAILEAIQLLPLNPYFGDVKKIKGEVDVWRRRIGVYRLFFRLTSERIVFVFHLERRTSKTY